MSTFTLTDLPDTDKERQALAFHSPSRCIRILQTGLAATADDDNGVINVWRDRFGKYRCERYRWCISQAAEAFTSLNGVRAWVKENLPLIA